MICVHCARLNCAYFERYFLLGTLCDSPKQIIQTTGLLNGLYTDEELQSETIKDRDAKIAFLQKAIDVLSKTQIWPTLLPKLHQRSHSYFTSFM